MNKSTGISILVVVVIVVIGLVFLQKQESKPGQYDEFATCLADNGTTFFGAFWCPNCNNQKALFGKSQSLIPYLECSNPDRSITEECAAEGIEAYPTWEFPDGSRQSGTLSLETLAERSSCELPGDSEEEATVENEGESSNVEGETPHEGNSMETPAS